MKRAVILAVVVACGGDKQEPPPAPPPAPKPSKPEKPTRIALGDCAPPNTHFESGPKPTDPARRAPPYFPDEHSALREYKPDLLACLTKPYGVGLVDLGGGEPRVFGVEGVAATCIIGVAKRVGKLGDGLRCSFAYGTIPFHELPSIDVSTNLADVRSRVRALQSAAPVSIIGPILVRAQPTTPMKVVAALVAEIYGAGRVDVIVTTGNTLPFAIDLPAVPIPQGTGTWWADGEYATLHVKADGVRVNGLEVPRADVASELGKQNIESIAISADADVPLAEVMHVAGMAKVPWRIAN